jgi:rubrerythrin
MTQQETVDTLFAKAIDLERKASELYEMLAEKFEHEPPVADFWRDYAAEERAHAEALASIRSRLSEDVLAREADERMMNYARKGMDRAVDQTVAQISNLDEAYELANDLEVGETNAVFEFLISEYAVAQEARGFLRSQLREHVTKVAMHFPEGYQSKRERVAVEALG